MNTSRRILYISLGLCLACLAGACFSNEKQNGILRMGYLQSDLHHLPAFVALEKNMYGLQGLSVEVGGVFRAGPEEMSAFAAKEIDFGYVGQAPATAAVMNSVADVKFIAQVNLEGSAIVAGSEPNLNNVTDLKGKVVAIPGHATMQDFLLRKALQKSGVAVADITMIVLKPPEMIQALKQKNIDAFIAWEPYPSQALQKNDGRVMLFSGDIWENHPCCVLVASGELCAERPEAVKSIQAAHRKACRFIADNRQESVAIGMKYTGMDRATVAMALSRITFTPVLEQGKGAEFVAFLRDLRYIKADDNAKKLKDLFYTELSSEAR